MSASSAVMESAKKIKLLLLDVDGVLTDGRLYYGNSGEEMKAFNIQDGLGIKLLQQGNVQAVLSLAGSLRYSSAAPTNWV